MVGRLMGPVGSGIGEGGRGRVMPVRVVLDAGVGRTREIRLPLSKLALGSAVEQQEN